MWVCEKTLVFLHAYIYEGVLNTERTKI